MKQLNESKLFRHFSFLPPILHCVKRKFEYLQNKGISLWKFVPNSRLRQEAQQLLKDYATRRVI